MRNSLFPIVMTLLVAVAAVLLIPSGGGAGHGGPIVDGGIFRLPKGSRGRVASMPGLVVEDRVAVERARDARVGLEPDGWGTVVLAGEDREPATQAVLLALAEDLTDRGTVVVLDPVGEHGQGPAIPLPSDRWLRVRTLRADAIPPSPGDLWHATVRVRHGAPRLPDDHPAAGLQWAGGTREAVLTVEHTSHASPGAARSWPTWWAAVGRAIGNEVVAAVEPETVPGAPLPVDWTHRHGAWANRLPDPPTESVARWFGCFQHDLVRGWIGRIDGTTTLGVGGRVADGATGDPVSAFAPIEKRLKAGEWTELKGDDEHAVYRWWQRERGSEILNFSSRDTGDGWDLACWEQRPQPAGVHEDWIDAAKAGDAVARDALRRHLSCQALPPDQQATARGLLADGDVAERSLAMAGLQTFAADPIALAVGVVSGRAAGPVRPLPEPGQDGRWFALTRGAAVEAPMRPTLARCGDTLVLWLVSPWRADDEAVKENHAVVGQAAPGVAYLRSLGARVTAAPGADAAAAAQLQAALSAKGGASQALVTAAGGTTSIPLPDGRLEATCRDGRLTLVWR